MSIRVLVVDDSALIRNLLTEMINQQPGMCVVGAAKDAYKAKEMVIDLKPDVITLDIEMPKVDGLTFLDRLMKARPTPVLMISTLTEIGADATVRALELGAVDYIPKPKLAVADGVREYQSLIVKKIRLAAKANVWKHPNKICHNQLKIKHRKPAGQIIAIGASTGGCEAIKLVLMDMPADSPAVVITQHMPSGFTASFAKRLDSVCHIKVKEAEHDEVLLPGHAYIAPGNRHLKIIKYAGQNRVCLDDSDRVTGHRPSVDVMFQSIVDTANKNVIGVLLTGMGKDGAQGLLNIKQAGGYTVVQSEPSCVVFGMPKEAIKLGAETEVTDLNDIAASIMDL